MSRVTIQDLQKKKKEGHKITMLTAYDALFAGIVDAVEVDVILVGDSLGVVVQGKENTLSVTMHEMIYHTQMVARATQYALVIGDMPFMSYQVSVQEALKNAGRFLQEAGAAGVKLEGGTRVIEQIEAMVKHGIPVMGHIGMTPQSIHKFGGYKVQGKEDSAASALIQDAQALEQAGVFAIVLEAIPSNLAKKITQAVSIPTIGIGAGPHCDGQVLVLYDLLGLFTQFTPKFVRRYADLRTQALEAIRRYKEEVELGKFPSEDESYH
jgi:3-methyl-2-oxobutanoate hydroxymethyltransferase